MNQGGGRRWESLMVDTSIFSRKKNSGGDQHAIRPCFNGVFPFDVMCIKSATFDVAWANGCDMMSIVTSDVMSRCIPRDIRQQTW